MAAMTSDLQLPKGRWHEASREEVGSHAGHRFCMILVFFLSFFY